MDKKRVNIIVVCVVIGSILLAALLVYVASGILVIDGDKFRVNKETENDIQEVESFFHEKGYDIDIIGAHTNGREHECNRFRMAGFGTASNLEKRGRKS